MNTLKKSLMATAAAATLGLGVAGAAQASTFASAILDINNFRLLHANGAAFSNTDFSQLSGTNDAHATASRDIIFAAGSDSRGILSGTNPNVLHQCVGAPCFPLAEDNFTPFASPPPVPGSFGYADQNLTGSSISINGGPTGAHAQTRADASTGLNTVTSGNSDVGTSTTFSFVLGNSETMTIAFDGTPYTQAFVSAGAGPTSNANARLSWSINIVDLSTGLSVFAFEPSALNALSAVSRTDASTGILTYNPGTTAYSSTTPMLTGGTSYQITIQHNTLANALQQEVPEPGTLAVVAAGLLSMSLLSRRRKQ